MLYLWGEGWSFFSCPKWDFGKREQMQDTYYAIGPFRLRIARK